jgi:hypothetical protein
VWCHGDATVKSQDVWEAFAAAQAKLARDANMTTNTEYLLRRARTVLANMAQENEREWWQFWKSRWAISDEPLRGDAGRLVELIDEVFR